MSPSGDYDFTRRPRADARSPITSSPGGSFRSGKPPDAPTGRPGSSLSCASKDTESRAQADRSPHASGTDPGRSRPTAVPHDHDPQDGRGGAGTGPARAPVLRARARPDLGRIHHLHDRGLGVRRGATSSGSEASRTCRTSRTLSSSSATITLMRSAEPTCRSFRRRPPERLGIDPAPRSSTWPALVISTVAPPPRGTTTGRGTSNGHPGGTVARSASADQMPRSGYAARGRSARYLSGDHERRATCSGSAC